MNSEITGYLILAFLMAWLIKTIHAGYAASTSPPSLICTNCGTRANGHIKNKGSSLIEIVLWLCFIIPGLIYSIWRRSNLPTICPACHTPSLIPIDSPIGQRLATQFPATK